MTMARTSDDYASDTICPIIQRGAMRSTTRYLLAASVVFAAAAMNSAIFASIEPQEPSSATKTVWDGVYTDVQSRRGEDVSKVSCVSCHGEELAGSDLAPALLGDDF